MSSIIVNGTNYTVHTFTSSGSFNVSGAGTVEVLVVAGGGGGAGGWEGAGGGAGGVQYHSSFPVSSGSYSVTVGLGGSGGGAGSSSSSNGANGGNSAFDALVANGGGGGANYANSNYNPGNNGGSGGGGSRVSPGGSSNQNSINGSNSYGNSGGAGPGSGGQSAGGGGGAGAAGQASVSGDIGGAGGAGMAFSITGSSVYYAGGGGGSGNSGTASGGSGGGGSGGNGGTSPTSGTASTGGGGGGSRQYASGANGGSGIVIVRYPNVAQGIAYPVQSQSFPYGTSSVSLNATTLDSATCKYGTTSGFDFSSSGTLMAGAGTTDHSSTLNGLLDGSSNTFFVRCNSSGTITESNVTFFIQNMSVSITSPSPNAAFDSAVTQASLEAATSGPSYCKWSNDSAFAYAGAGTLMSGAGTASHTATITGLQSNKSYSIYVKCNDSQNRIFSAGVNFSVSPAVYLLNGAGCVSGGDCVISSSQTINQSVAYNFSSLVINPGVTVTVASVNGGAGGSVWFYIQNDANISGTINAIGAYAVAASNPSGGGYAGGTSDTGAAGGAGGGLVSIYAKNINMAGTINVSGGQGAPAAGDHPGGGGSGGTIRLVAGRINFTGTLSGVGGTSGQGGGSGGSGCGGGGAGGSLLFVPFQSASLASGSMNFNGGTQLNTANSRCSAGEGSGKRGGGVYYGGTGGGSGGTGAHAGDCGTPCMTSNANPARNIRIYNSYVPSGSTFSISSSGYASGLADLYLVNSSSAFSGLSATYKPEKAFGATLDAYSKPVQSANFNITNSSSQQAVSSFATDSSGIGVSNSTLAAGNNYGVSVSGITLGSLVGFGYMGSGGFPSGSNSTQASAVPAAMLVAWLPGGQISISQVTSPAFSTFSGLTTNFSGIADLTRVENMTLDMPGKGRIRFPPAHFVNAANQDFDSHVVIGNGFISVNSSALDSSFNSTATLVMDLTGVYSGAATPVIYYYEPFAQDLATIIQNGTACSAPRCTGISWNSTSQTLVFNVSGFSDYGVNGSGEFGGAGSGPSNSSGTIGINITSTNQIAVYTSSAMNNSAFSFVPVIPPAAGSITLTSNESSNVTGGDTGFLVENQGNVNVSITVASDKAAAGFIGGSSPLFRMFGAENKTGSCPSINASAQDLSASAITICPSLAFSDSQDTIWAYVLVRIDSDSPPQTNTATLTFTSTQA
ncbi:MAG: glycine-rich domain-containing protein [Candidatus Micrarchaeia archaeon]